MILYLWKKARALGAFLRSRAFAVSMLSLVCAFVVFKVSYGTNTVYLVDSESERAVRHTMESQPDAILQALGVENSEDAEVNFSGVSGQFAQVNLEDLLHVTITVDGRTISCQVENGTTVGELLHKNGIVYDGNDLLEPASEKPLEEGDAIAIKRVEYEEYTINEAIPFQTTHKNTSLLRLGTNRCIQQGADGIKALTYVRRTVDGVREDVQLLGSQIIQSPVTETILIGSVASVSPLDFDLDVDEHGKPVEFVRVLQNQVATGYSARQGAKTASGRFAVAGHVAVDPREIPYGSRLYIASSDNKFVYGCAIAADTGTGLMADIVDVDLFYDTYAESVLNGRRIVDIYVLD